MTVGCVCKKNHWKDLFSGVLAQIRILLPFATGCYKISRAKRRYSVILNVSYEDQNTAKRRFQRFKSDNFYWNLEICFHILTLFYKKNYSVFFEMARQVIYDHEFLEDGKCDWILCFHFITCSLTHCTQQKKQKRKILQPSVSKYTNFLD